MLSTDALEFQWPRACWMSIVWHQSFMQTITWPHLHEFGWKIADDELKFVWDSHANLTRVMARLKLWSQGCSCDKSECKPSSQCGCVRSGKACGPGRKCKSTCQNQMKDKGPVGLSEQLEVVIAEGGFGENMIELPQSQNVVTTLEDDISDHNVVTTLVDDISDHNVVTTLEDDISDLNGPTATQVDDISDLVSDIQIISLL